MKVRENYGTSEGELLYVKNLTFAFNNLYSKGYIDKSIMQTISVNTLKSNATYFIIGNPPKMKKFFKIFIHPVSYFLS